MYGDGNAAEFADESARKDYQSDAFGISWRWPRCGSLGSQPIISARGAKSLPNEASSQYLLNEKG